MTGGYHFRCCFFKVGAQVEDKVAILGGGPSGLAMGSLWASHGYRVNVWVRDVDRLACICPPEGITVVGEQVTTFSPSLVSSDLAEVLEGVKIAIVCTPGAGHDFIACELQSLAADVIDDLLTAFAGTMFWRPEFQGPTRERA